MISHIFDEIGRAQKRLSARIGKPVALKRSGEIVTLLSVEYGQAEVKRESGEILQVHVAALKARP
jgi:hypothetical protein